MSGHGPFPRRRRLEDPRFKGGMLGITLVALATLVLVAAAAAIAAAVAAVF